MATQPVTVGELRDRDPVMRQPAYRSSEPMTIRQVREVLDDWMRKHPDWSDDLLIIGCEHHDAHPIAGPSIDVTRPMLFPTLGPA